MKLGKVTNTSRLQIDVAGQTRIDLSLEEMNKAWRSTLPSVFPAGEEAVHV
jgi:hypothetical protein